MKKIFLLSIIVCGYFIAHPQNVGIGTTTPASKLHVKGSVDTSQLTIDANTIQSNRHPLIRLRDANGKDLLHLHSDDTSNVFIGLNAGRNNAINLNGMYNTFIGGSAGKSNTSGLSNTANGCAALYSNTTGIINTANGAFTLYSNTTGAGNTANGTVALYSNTTGNHNTVNGYASLNRSTTGSYNSANGSFTLQFNSTGNFNTVNGFEALYANTTGSNNTANGALALQNTTAADYNTALGYNAGAQYDNGYNNVFLGANVDVNGAGYYNVIAIGQGTVCTGSSQVTMGNGATGVYRAYANWSNISDGRFKKNIQENVPGLDFITKLKPVTYNLDAAGLDAFLHKNYDYQASLKTGGADKLNNRQFQPNDDASKAVYSKALQEKETTVQTGFVAQEVEATAKKMGFNFSGVDAPANANDVYGLRYAEFVVPLVKAVQEQQQMITDMQKRIGLLEEQNKLLQQQINKH